MSIEKECILLFFGIVSVLTLLYLMKNYINNCEENNIEHYGLLSRAAKNVKDAKDASKRARKRVKDALGVNNTINVDASASVQQNTNNDAPAPAQRGTQQNTNNDAPAPAQRGTRQNTNNDAPAPAQRGTQQNTNNDAPAPAQRGTQQNTNNDAPAPAQRDGSQTANNDAPVPVQRGTSQGIQDIENALDENKKSNWDEINPLSKMKMLFDGLNNLNSEMEIAQSGLDKDLKKMGELKTNIDKIINDKMVIPTKFNELSIDNLTASNISGNEVNVETVNVKNLNVTGKITLPKGFNMPNGAGSTAAAPQDEYILNKPHTYIHGKYAPLTSVKTAENPQKCFNACKASEYEYKNRKVHPNACTFESDKDEQNCRCVWIRRHRPEYYYTHEPATSIISL